MIVHIESPGMLSTIQDNGRQGYRAYGLPAAGAMDRRSLGIANVLLGNAQDEAALEMTLMAATIRFEGEGIVALAGGDLGATLNDWPLSPVGSFAVHDGDVLRFQGTKWGCRSYLAVAGGFDIPSEMGSKSTYIRGGVGGAHGRALRRGDALSARAVEQAMPSYIGALPPYLWQHILPAGQPVRVLFGPQDDYFDSTNLAAFLQTEWTIGNDADRMGYRLEGPALVHRDRKEIVSDGVVPGAIQVPGHGRPIVLLSDAQTSGGYAKIATVISADLGLFGQLLPGNTVRFVAVGHDAARIAREENQARVSCVEQWLQKHRADARHRAQRFTAQVQGNTYDISVHKLEES